MNGAELIAVERQRQVEQEGWTPEHDDGHDRGQIAKAATAYLYHARGLTLTKREWPWEWEAWKPSDPIRSLVKAGALIAAEIDRLQRADSGEGE